MTKNGDEIVQTIRISTVNARSLKHKENLISGEFLNNNMEITVITETWLKNTDEDDAWTLSLELNNCAHQILTKTGLTEERRNIPSNTKEIQNNYRTRS